MVELNGGGARIRQAVGADGALGAASPGAPVGQDPVAGGPVIDLYGEIDIANADDVRAVVESAISPRVDEVVFDLDRLTFMDSSGLAVLVFAASQVPSVHLRNVSPLIRRVVEASGLASVLVMQP